MPHAGKLLHGCITYAECGRPGHHETALLFQSLEFIIIAVILQVGHDLRVAGIIGL